MGKNFFEATSSINSLSAPLILAESSFEISDDFSRTARWANEDLKS